MLADRPDIIGRGGRDIQEDPNIRRRHHPPGRPQVGAGLTDGVGVVVAVTVSSAARARSAAVSVGPLVAVSPGVAVKVVWWSRPVGVVVEIAPAGRSTGAGRGRG